MRFVYFLNEQEKSYGKGITFVDIDETLFHTTAKINVVKDNNVIKQLTNQEFNTYKLQPGESFDFSEFRDASIFKKTSKPIFQTINRINKMIKQIKMSFKDSKIVFLTAREAFKDMKTFKDTFKQFQIDVSKTEFEFVGELANKKESLGVPKSDLTISKLKKEIIIDYIKTGNYRRVRLIDDDMKNLKDFLSIKDSLNDNIIKNVKEKHKIRSSETIAPIEFYALQVLPDGSLRRVN